jgi:caffeoyl-CoA O-methyltransferase
LALLDFLSPQAQAYAERFSHPADPLLREVEQYTLAHHAAAHMMSGFLQGRFLSLISELLCPERILEIGTFTGYSALCLAKGLPPTGILHTIELREKEVQLAQSFFDRSNYSAQIQLHQGDAKLIVPALHEKWDLVFIDADKVSYLDYFNMVFPSVRLGGYILADNVFFHGHVFEEKPSGKNAEALAQFNQAMVARTDIEVSMVPIRDGLSVIKKIG